MNTKPDRVPEQPSSVAQSHEDKSVDLCDRADVVGGDN